MESRQGNLTEGQRRIDEEQVISVPQRHNVLDYQYVGRFKTLDITPSVQNIERWVATNTGAITITNFDNGQDGQAIDILGDGFTTVEHNAQIKRAAGVDGLLEVDRVYRFVRFPVVGAPSIWVEQ